MLTNYLRVLLTVSVLVDTVRLEKYLPILFWHSAGESSYSEESSMYINFIKSYLENDVYIKSVQIGSNPGLDSIESLKTHPFNQIQQICDEIRNDPKMANGYNSIGLSQGGLLLRGLAQKCPDPPMMNLISLGAPQNGVHQYPRCESRFGSLCGMLKWCINHSAYSWLGQKIVPLTYWHDTNEPRYRQGSTFLAFINNENQINTDYIINLSKLKRLILVKYEQDKALIPNESSWFGHYTEQGYEYSMESTELYKEDKLGLQALVASGKLVRLISPGDHIIIDPTWFVQNIIPYLREV